MKVFAIIVLICYLTSTFALLDKNLNEACQTNSDCKWAYSYCDNTHKCGCMNGFRARMNDNCVAEHLLCPPIIGGGIITEQKVGPKCMATLELDPFRVVNHTCPNNYFCYRYPRSYTSEKNVQEGHCCPQPPMDVAVGITCPLTPILNATCLDMARYGGGAPIPTELYPLCPSTHECINQPYRNDRLCCPNPCIGSNTHINILGQCTNLAYFEQECEHDAQCPEKTICRQNPSGGKTCRCKDGQHLDPSPTPHCVPN